KDSTVVAHLATSIDPAVPVVRFSHGLDFPEVVEHCATLADRYGWDYRVVQMATFAEFAERIEAALRDVDAAVRTHADPRHHEMVTAALGWEPTSLLWGLRADESTRRTLNGVTRHRADGVTTVAPLYGWSSLDVHAYH